jgi:2-haloalkanoic acid dehalogenase type II
MISRLEAVAFDLDMTLCHYELTVEEVIEQALARAKVPKDTLGPIGRLADDYNSAWWATEEALAVPIDELRRRAWTRIVEEHGVAEPGLADRIADAFNEIRRETGVLLFDDVPAFLADLRARYRVGILTNGPSSMQWAKIEELGLKGAVHEIVVSGDRGVFKPDPAPFLELVEKLAVTAERALFVGDSFEHDIVGAHRIGMRTAWVTQHEAEEDGAIRPDYVVGRATDLREVLL